MNRSARLSGIVAATGILFLSAGCGTMQLAYTSPQSGAADQGPIQVAFEDQRAPGKGGEDPYVVGFLRNAFGMPFAVKAAPDREPSQVVARLVAECLEAAGFQIVDASHEAPRLSVTLAEFWSDGYQHNRLWLLAPMGLSGAGSSRSVWSRDFRINEGWTAKTAGYSQMNSGYNKLLETTRNELIALFQSAEFRAKVRSL